MKFTILFEGNHDVWELFWDDHGTWIKRINIFNWVSSKKKGKTITNLKKTFELKEYLFVYQAQIPQGYNLKK